MKYCVTLVTVDTAVNAEKIGRKLVDEGHAACVNVIPSVTSIYRWKGKRMEGREALLIIKTRASRAAGLTKRVIELHAYEVPEIIHLPIQAGSKEYLEWINEVTR